MKLNSTRHLWLMTGCLLSLTTAFAQQRTPLDIASEHVRTHFSEWNLTEQDVADLYVSRQYTDATTGISRVYFNQRYAGVPVQNAILNLSITAEGKVFFVGKRFVPNLASKINTTVPVLRAEDAVMKAAEAVGTSAESLRLLQQISPQEFIFEKGTTARENIKVSLCFQPQNDKAFLAWSVEFAPVGSSDYWNIRIGAVSGETLEKDNYTVYCKVDGNTFRHEHEGDGHPANCELEDAAQEMGALTGDAYNVWPHPYESPNHGPRTLVTDPADPTASPFGWHDTNGADGAEWTITRGNNVHAFEDRNNDDVSSGNEPDGGADLHFDFPFDPTWEAQQYVDAATVNLFYTCNFMHDLSYHYGFTEAAGNFQDNNYGNGGTGNDHLIARAQDGADLLDPALQNNANIVVLPDGESAVMQMYVFTSTGSLLTVNSPASVAGPIVNVNLPATGWGAGAFVGTTPVFGEVVIVEDGIADPFNSDACEELTNAAELVGKVALIDRGGCEFGFKAFQAQEAGAIAVIICNFEDAALGMLGGVAGPNVTIPTLMIYSTDCQTIRQFAGNGLTVTLVQPDNSGPEFLDGDLDNGIVLHEYSHGISRRLTGVGCFGNAEQMGEGWSDFISIATTVRPGETGEMKRGVGTYAQGLPPESAGFRRHPYSTDMDVNPLTYGDVAGNPEEHDLGEVWVTMLWEMYWAFVEEYGWEADLINGTAGNIMALRLVFEGLKSQACSPGFVDGRDAILAADQALFNGENQCLIWKAFAKRGCGYSADQGSSTSAGDQVEAFDIPPVCLNSMTIKKSVTDFIEAGDDIEVTIEVGNFKQETVTNVLLTDNIPENCEFKAGSANITASVQGNSVVFELGTMAFFDTKTITYKLTTDPNKPSIRQWLDDIPEALSDNWFYYFDSDAPTTSNIWSISDVFVHSPDFAWNCEDVATESRQTLEMDETKAWHVSGTRPALRFYHQIESTPGSDGGLVEVKDVTDNVWSQVPEKMLRNGYPSEISYFTFITPHLDAFSGSSNGEFIPTYVDLSEWADKDLLIRFRFGTEDVAADNATEPGWAVDDIEFMDLLSYNGEACVTSNQGDNLCAIAPEEGTIVESDFVSSTTEPLKDISFRVYPNPANDQLNVALNSSRPQEVTISLLTLDGRTVMARSANVFGNEFIPLDVRSQPAGFYFVKISTEEGVIVQKVVIE